MDFFIWRRGRDSNPGNPQRLNGFQDRPIRPLWHLSCFGFRISEIGFQINIRNPKSEIRYPRLRRLRDDFRTFDWVEIWDNLKYSTRSIESFLIVKP